MIKIIEKIFILSACFWQRLFWGPARKRVLEPKNILIVQTAKLGDMVCTTPLFRALKNKYSNCQITVMSTSINKDLLEYNQDVDNFIIYDKKVRLVIKTLRVKKFDVAILTTPNFKALAMLYLSGISTIIAPYVTNGKSAYETRSYKTVLKFVTAVPHQMGSYAPQEYLRLLKPLSIISDDTVKHLAFSKEGERKVLDLFTKNELDQNSDFIVGIIPSAGNQIKLWPIDHFVEVANFLYQEYHATIVLLGSVSDENLTTEMIRKMPTIKVLNTVGHLTIDELKATISHLNLVVGVDTGPIYIAEAFGIPTLDIVGPMDEREQPPQGEFHKVVVPPFKRIPELHIMNAHSYNFNEARRQTESITPDMVKNALRQLIPKIIYG